MADVDLLALEAARATPSAVLAATAGTNVSAAAVIRTLGRLRSPDSLPTLEAASRSDDPTLVAAAAEALGRTPGGLAAIRAGVAGVTAATPTAVAAAWIDALGRLGEGSDVHMLVDLLDDRAACANVAAVALGRMGRRKVEGMDPALDSLTAALVRPDVASGAAFALFRIGMGRASMVAVQRATDCAGTSPVPEARAWCSRAVWPRLDVSARATRFVDGVTDSSRLVRVAVLDALGPGDVSVDLVAPWLSSTDTWVASAATAALGRLDEDAAREALASVATDTKRPWRAAAALDAIGRPDRVAASDASVDSWVRAALVGLETDTVTLVRFALEDADSRVRVAAAAELSERPSVGWRSGLDLLKSTDDVVREVGMGLVGERGDPSAAKALLPFVLGETAPEAFHLGVVALRDLASRHVRTLDNRDPAVGVVLQRAGQADTARTRAVASALARSLGLTVPVVHPVSVVEPALDRRTLAILTSDGEFTVELDPETAPLAVARFLELVTSDAMDGLVFHRMVPGFVVQTGCPRGDGWGATGTPLPDEVSLLPFGAGAIGMARSDADSGASQWFVTLSDQPHLVGDYTRFGVVVSGLHVVTHLEVGDTVLDVVVLP